MKFLTRFAEVWKEIFRFLGLGFILAGLAYLCFYIYFVFALYEISIIADIALAIGAGLSTGLVIYALTNHRSRKERELIEMMNKSQKAKNDCLTLRDSLSKYHAKLRYPWYEVDTYKLSPAVIENWFAIRHHLLDLSYMNHHTLPELKEVKAIYKNDAFLENIMKIIESIIHCMKDEECFTYLTKFETEIEKIQDVIRTVNYRAEDELRRLRGSLI